MLSCPAARSSIRRVRGPCNPPPPIWREREEGEGEGVEDPRPLHTPLSLLTNSTSRISRRYLTISRSGGSEAPLPPPMGHSPQSAPPAPPRFARPPGPQPTPLPPHPTQSPPPFPLKISPPRCPGSAPPGPSGGPPRRRGRPPTPAAPPRRCDSACMRARVRTCANARVTQYRNDARDSRVVYRNGARVRE